MNRAQGWLENQTHRAVLFGNPGSIVRRLSSMSLLLVSFCNLSAPGLGLGVYDFEQDSLRWLDLRSMGRPLTGVTGVSFVHRGCWFATQERSPVRLGYLDDRFALQQIYEVPELDDVHSIFPDGNGLLVVNTGRNAL